MARLRYNLLTNTLANPLTGVSTTINFTTALQEFGTNIPTIAAPDYLPLTLSGTEVVWLTAYTSGATSGTIQRAPTGEDSVATTHAPGGTVENNPTKMDYDSGVGKQTFVKIAAYDSSDFDMETADYLCVGTADDVTFQEAYDVIDDTGGYGATIMVATGTYTFDATVNIYAEAYHVHWLGLPAYPGRLQGDTSYAPGVWMLRSGAVQFFDIAGSHTFENFAWYESGSYTAPLFNPTFGSTNLQFNRCIFENYATAMQAIEIEDSVFLTLDDCMVIADGDCISSSSTDLRLFANRCDFSSYEGSGINLQQVGSSSEISLIDCREESLGGTSDYGYRIDGNSAGSMPDITIRGGHCKGNPLEDIYISDAASVLIDGVTVKQGSSLSAIRMSNVDEGRITNCFLDRPGQHGIWLFDCDDVLVSGNDIEGASTGTDNTYSGIILDGDTNRCHITGNKIYSQGTNKALYGIRVDDSTCDDNFIAGDNNLRGSSKTGGNEVSDLGTNTQGHEVLMFAVGDETTPITTGNAKITFRMPYPFCLTKVRASLTTQSSSGNPTFDINEGIAGAGTVLSTKLSIDSGARTSVGASSAAVISDPAIADDAEMTIDIDTAGTGATGPKISLMGWRR